MWPTLPVCSHVNYRRTALRAAARLSGGTRELCACAFAGVLVPHPHSSFTHYLCTETGSVERCLTATYVCIYGDRLREWCIINADCISAANSTRGLVNIRMSLRCALRGVRFGSFDLCDLIACVI